MDACGPLAGILDRRPPRLPLATAARALAGPPELAAVPVVSPQIALLGGWLLVGRILEAYSESFPWLWVTVPSDKLSVKISSRSPSLSRMNAKASSSEIAFPSVVRFSTARTRSLRSSSRKPCYSFVQSPRVSR